MDSLSALGVFVRAAEARSFTAAGRRLNVSSSAVGKSISRLEDRLGVRLLHRNTRAMTLTPDPGKIAERLLAAVEAAGDDEQDNTTICVMRVVDVREALAP